MEFSTTAKCTLAIITTMLGCTYWLTHTIKTAAPSEYYRQFETLQADLDAIDRTVSEIASNTDSIDKRLMSPAERFRSLPNLQKP